MVTITLCIILVKRKKISWPIDKAAGTWYNDARGIMPTSEYAGMAQLVEHLTRNEKVAGSNPATSSNPHRMFPVGIFCRLFLPSVQKFYEQAEVLNAILTTFLQTVQKVGLYSKKMGA